MLNLRSKNGPIDTNSHKIMDIDELAAHTGEAVPYLEKMGVMGDLGVIYNKNGKPGYDTEHINALIANEGPTVARRLPPTNKAMGDCMDTRTTNFKVSY